MNESELRAKYGYNELPQKKENLPLLYLKTLWNPLAWTMEVTILVTALSGNFFESILIAVLLCTNSLINIYQRHSADAALASLSRTMQITVRAFRNGSWILLPARELLPGDRIRLRTGDVIAADAITEEGTVSVDLSSLTGESLPSEIGVGELLYSGGIVQHGEATAKVTATGTSTKFGKTTELLEVAHPPTHMEQVVFKVIRYLFVANMVVALVVVIFGIEAHVQTLQIVTFVIVILLMSVPVAFPTMFAVAQSYGALQLSRGKNGSVLVRRLAAVQEAASMNVLCSDKTGTLTQNTLSVAEVHALGTYTEEKLLAFACTASDESDEDAIDHAIFQYASKRNILPLTRTSFTPFDFTSKRTEASVVLDGTTLHIEKGLPTILLTDTTAQKAEAVGVVEAMSSKGLRVLAVVVTQGDVRECIGLIGLADPIREDAPQLIRELNALGVRVMMITGDGLLTAKAIALQLGLAGEVFTARQLKESPELAVTGSVCAEAFPEDKLTIIAALQKQGHIVGMTGDGVNDAPALQQAEVGIAVECAAEVAKQSASLILTNPGLEGVREAVLMSRSVYMRIHTWVVNKVVKSIEILLITTLIFFITHMYILSPLFGVLILFANDFVAISIATDTAKPMKTPAKWNVKALSIGASLVALVPFILLLGVYGIVQSLGYSVDILRTVVFTTLIYFSVTTLLAVRTHEHGWKVALSRTLVISLLFSIVFASILSGFGLLITPIPALFFVLIISSAVLNFFGIDMVKRIPWITSKLYV
jgi:H+-transporting ATPase